jgi:3-oxoacyl-[acyl-carrier protein] reductase
VDYGSFNILSNVLKLGIIQTSRTQKFWKKDEYQKKMGRIIPQGKLGTPQEVANALPCFFDREQYINGSSLFVTGGLPMMQSKGILES